jgi:outer membrane receptor protein involved in Fe transport
MTAQVAATADEDIVYLSPFEVTSEGTLGYSSSQTLAGTRLRTDLRDLANSISVVNSEFLKDTGATSSQDLLVYTANTEVGGVYGNFSGAGGSSTYNENSKLIRPSENTRVRGLDSADNTRDYFLTEAPWDSYNVERVELQRGPNSILFGVGSPAGIINAGTKGATFKDQGTIEARVGSFGSVRGSIDVNRELIEEVLSVRVMGLYKDTKYQQEPAYEQDDRVFVALRFEPKLFGKNSSTSIRANFEQGDIEANRPRALPPIDAITPWFQTGTSNGFANLNKLTLNPTITWDQYGSYNGVTDQMYPWFREAFLGRIMSSNPATFYDANGAVAPVSMMGMIGTSKGRSDTGLQDGTIGGIEFSRLWGISTFNNYARGAIQGGQYYSNYSLSDSSIFDFYNKLMDGDNKKEWQSWKTGNFSLAQTFLSNRVGFELSHFFQNYEEGQYGFLNGDQYAISVDINTTFPTAPSTRTAAAPTLPTAATTETRKTTSHATAPAPQRLLTCARRTSSKNPG